jgi:hypothetical protein
MPEKPYDHNQIELKWYDRWQDATFYRAEENSTAPKFYVLEMLPYPSGALHIGHIRNYSIGDALARYKWMRGFNVLHPMGWDAFGLPAEQHAIETGTHPRLTTQKNIAEFRRQIKMLGFSYDWDREVDTTDPNYFKWTQWIFLVLFDTWYDAEQKRGRPIDELPIPADVQAKGAAAVSCSGAIRMIAPLGYIDFLCSIKNAKMVLTDSGGIQEETTCLDVPCVTLRENTERPATVEVGTNVLAGVKKEDIREAIRRQMDIRKPSIVPDLWDGKSALRILDAIILNLQKVWVDEAPTQMAAQTGLVGGIVGTSAINLAGA